MARKKSTKVTTPVEAVSGQIEPVKAVKQQDLVLFDKASKELQLKRHKTIGSLFDKAAEVIGNFLEDPNADISAKMFPAKLATDIYLAQEKFNREDERIEIEKRKLALEETKANVSIGAFNQQNNYLLPVDQSQPVDLAELKKKQEKLLASFIPGPDRRD